MGQLWTWSLFGARRSLERRARRRRCAVQCAFLIRLGGSDYAECHLLKVTPSGSRRSCRGLGARVHVFRIPLMIGRANHLPGWCYRLRFPPRIDNVWFGGYNYMEWTWLVSLKSNYTSKIIKLEPWNTQHRTLQSYSTRRRALSMARRWINGPSIVSIGGHLGNFCIPHSTALSVRNNGRTEWPIVNRWTVVHFHRLTLNIILNFSQINVLVRNYRYAEWIVDQSTDHSNFRLFKVSIFLNLAIDRPDR